METPSFSLRRSQLKLPPPISTLTTVTASAGRTKSVTAVGATGPTDIRVYPTPGDGSAPLVSNLNLNPRQTAADLAISRIGDPDTVGRGQVRLRNAAGTVALVADLAGWFGP